MQVLSTIDETKELVKSWKKQGFIVGFVPTMGALHIGHLSLVNEARKVCDKVVVSIFVNPTQFGPNEDFDNYPRTFEQDKKACSENGVDLIFAPVAIEMYPEFSSNKKNLTKVVPPVEHVDKLCGKSREGHFDGVATVVLKLFNIVQPDKAFFGQKDAQQLIIIKKICKDLNVPVEVVGCPIIREESGLAYSSRNAYLNSEDKKKASSIYKVLKKIIKLYNSGCEDKHKIFKESLELLHEDFELEYIEAYDLDSFECQNRLNNNSFVAIAARLSGVRLIDNITMNLVKDL